MSTNERAHGPIASVCPACLIAGYGGDEIRASLYPDGNIVCINCSSVIPSVKDDDMKVIRGLPTSLKYSVACVLRGRNISAPGLSLKRHSCGVGERSESSNAVAAMTLNFDAVAENDARVEVAFSGVDPLAQLTFSFDNRQVGEHTEARYRALLRSTHRQTTEDASAAALEAELVTKLCPKDMAAAIGRLVVSGYAVQVKQLDALMRRVVLCFEADASASSSNAPKIKAECTWYL